MAPWSYTTPTVTFRYAVVVESTPCACIDFVDSRDIFDLKDALASTLHRLFLASRAGDPVGPERRERRAAFDPIRRWLARHRRERP